jgi:Zn-dependent protease with chaperone function
VAFGFWLAMNEQPLGSTNWLAALGISFLPWIFLAFGGIALALTNIKLAPQITRAREVHDSLSRGLKVTNNFAGYPVAIVELPVKVAFTVKLNGAQTIVLGRGVMASLSSSQVEAVMWHEVGHIKGGHNRLKRIAALAYSVAPFVRASLLLGQEVELLCEVEANNFALRHVSIDDLKAAHRVFSF